MSTAHLSEDGTILHIHIPMHLRRRGGRKIIITPDGHPAEPGPTPTPALPDDPMVRDLVKARRWQTLLEFGAAATNSQKRRWGRTVSSAPEGDRPRMAGVTIKDLAEKEGVDRSYLARFLRLNVLAPAIVERVLGGDYPDTLNLESLRAGIPLDWAEQGRRFGVATGDTHTAQSHGTVFHGLG